MTRKRRNPFVKPNLRRGEQVPEHMREATAQARREARAVAERERAERKARRAERLERGAQRLQERLSPLGRVAPAITGTLMWLIRIPAALIATLLDLFTDANRWFRGRIGPAAAGAGALVSRLVTPARTVAFVCAAAAGVLLASQFVDYRGIAVGASGYEGEIGTVAGAPLTDKETAVSAHSYALVGVAAVALVLIVLTLRGRWRLGRAVGLAGLAGIVVGLAVDAPAGLDAGPSGVSYLDTEARLIEGFWVQMAASATLLVCGPLLGLYVKRGAAAGASPDREARRRARRARAARGPREATA